MTIKFVSILQGIVDVYHRIGIVGASDGVQLVGRQTDFESLMIIAGQEFKVYWSTMKTSEFISQFLWRLA